LPGRNESDNQSTFCSEQPRIAKRMVCTKYHFKMMTICVWDCDRLFQFLLAWLLSNKPWFPHRLSLEQAELAKKINSVKPNLNGSTDGNAWQTAGQQNTLSACQTYLKQKLRTAQA
jgi:hypothetical protein